MLSQIVQNIMQIRNRIAIAAQKAGTNPEAVKMIAVTKTVDLPQMLEAIEAGITALGENRVQELTRKYPQLTKPVEWHMIGHLQTNKVKYIIDKVALIHSVDRLALAREIAQRALQAGKTLSVLVQVNIAEETSKHGLKVAEVKPFIKEIASLHNLKVQGLMTMAPYVQNPEETRPVFRKLRLLKEELEQEAWSGTEMRYLSMGMTNDFEVAVEEGANLIRIGTGIFGRRG